MYYVVLIPSFVAQYVGEEGEDCVLNAAISVANPWKLEVASLALQRTWLGLNVYSKTMGTSMKKLFERCVTTIVGFTKHSKLTTFAGTKNK